jgi:hypothetical protein
MLMKNTAAGTEKRVTVFSGKLRRYDSVTANMQPKSNPGPIYNIRLAKEQKPGSVLRTFASGSTDRLVKQPEVYYK